MSGGTRAVDNNLGILIRQEYRGRFSNFVGREINRSWQVGMIKCHLCQCLNQLKLVAALDLVKQIISRNYSHHDCSLSFTRDLSVDQNPFFERTYGFTSRLSHQLHITTVSGFQKTSSQVILTPKVKTELRWRHFEC